MDEKLMLSTDSIINSKTIDMNRPHILKKSGSIDGTQSPMLKSFFNMNSDGQNTMKDRKLKIKSSKDLRQQCPIKFKTGKLKGYSKKGKKADEKICWDNLDNKENIRKYMKKKRKKLVKNEVREKLFDIKKQTKI